MDRHVALQRQEGDTAGPYGPASLDGAPGTPNPQGGAQPSDKAVADPERKGTRTAKPPQDKPSQDGNEDGRSREAAMPQPS